LNDLIFTPTLVPYDVWPLIFFSFVACRVLTRVSNVVSPKFKPYQRLPAIEKAEWHTRITSTAHALLAFVLSVYVVITDYDLFVNPVHGDNYISNLCFAIGAGYFLSDFIEIVRHQIPPLFPIVTHHLLAGWGFLSCVSTNGAAKWFATYLLITEGSTPLNNLYWMCERCNVPFKLKYIVGVLFSCSWVLFRISPFPFLLYRLYVHWHQIQLLRLYNLILLVLNVTFLMVMNYTWFLTGPFYAMVFGPHLDEKHTEKSLLFQQSSDCIAEKNKKNQ